MPCSELDVWILGPWRIAHVCLSNHFPFPLLIPETSAFLPSGCLCRLWSSEQVTVPLVIRISHKMAPAVQIKVLYWARSAGPSFWERRQDLKTASPLCHCRSFSYISLHLLTASQPHLKYRFIPAANFKWFWRRKTMCVCVCVCICVCVWWNGVVGREREFVGPKFVSSALCASQSLCVLWAPPLEVKYALFVLFA